jgi:hypothetical protein
VSRNASRVLLNTRDGAPDKIGGPGFENAHRHLPSAHRLRNRLCPRSRLISWAPRLAWLLARVRSSRLATADDLRWRDASAQGELPRQNAELPCLVLRRDARHWPRAVYSRNSGWCTTSDMGGRPGCSTGMCNAVVELCTHRICDSGTHRGARSSAGSPMGYQA